MAEKRGRKPVPARTPTSPSSSVQAFGTVSNPAIASSSLQPAISQSNNFLETDDNDQPPSYSGPSISSSALSSPPSEAQQTRNQITIPGLPPVDFRHYHVMDAKLSDDSTTLVSTNTQYNWNAHHLLGLIKRHATLPPHPQIRIIGRRSRLANPDFDIRISMMRYIVRDANSGASAGWNYVRMVGNAELAFRGGKVESTVPTVKGGLEDWVRKFVAEESKEKSFTLKKIVSNWDTDYLEGKIHALVASTNYNGTVQVSFPITHCALTIQPANASAWYQKLGQLFQPAQPKKYEVVTAVWPYAAMAPGENHGQGNSWAVKSEGKFWEEWKDVLKWAVMEQRRGWLSLEDYMEFAMGQGWMGRQQTKDWGMPQDYNSGR